MRINNIFQVEKLPVGATEAFETLCKDEGIHFERIISNGQVTPADEWYQQKTNEFVILLKGKASIELPEGRIIHLGEGDHILIPKELKHRVIYTSKNPHCIWLAVHFK
jgi:cupin 2 domain-containing protein